jgi:hypothetical protein
MKHVKQVEGREELIRDPTSQAVINTDHDAYRNRLSQKELANRRKRKEIDDNNKILTLEQEMKELKMLVGKLLSKE